MNRTEQLPLLTVTERKKKKQPTVIISIESVCAEQQDANLPTQLRRNLYLIKKKYFEKIMNIFGGATVFQFYTLIIEQNIIYMKL